MEDRRYKINTAGLLWWLLNGTYEEHFHSQYIDDFTVLFRIRVDNVPYCTNTVDFIWVIRFLEIKSILCSVLNWYMNNAGDVYFAIMLFVCSFVLTNILRFACFIYCCLKTPHEMLYTPLFSRDILSVGFVRRDEMVVCSGFTLYFYGFYD